MAAEDEQDNQDKESAGGGKKKLIMFVIVGLFLIGASVGGTIAALSFLKKDDAPATTEDAEQVEEKPSAPAIYYPLKPEYIVNIDARGRRRFLRLDISLMTREDDVIAAIELHRPELDNVVNLVAGGQIFEEVQTPEGKEFLRLQLLEDMRSVFEKEIGKPGIEQVLFTNFVMQ